MSQNQAAHLTASHHPARKEETYDLTFIAAALLFAFLFLALVAFSAFVE
jgi:hypothetical protein